MFITPLFFICILVIMPYTMSRYRGRVYGIPRPSSATKRRWEQERIVAILQQRASSDMDIWQSNYRSNGPNICKFCNSLNATWFHRIKNRHQKKLNLSHQDLQKIKDLYMEEVYTPYNFPDTWRNPKEWKDQNGNPLRLRDISEEEIIRWYFNKCPQITFSDIFSIISTLFVSFIVTLFLASLMA